MSRTFTPWIAAALGALLVVTSASAKDTPAPWHQQAVLDKHLDLACDVVEKICRAKFKVRPTVQRSDAATVAKLLLIDFSHVPEEMLPKASHKAVAEALAPEMFAKYDTLNHVIHVLPETIDRVRAGAEGQVPLGLDHLRLLLVHEVTHALDFPRYKLVGKRKARKRTEEHLALGAIVEGHAQWVAERASIRWGLEEEFARLTDAFLGDHEPGSDSDKAMRAAQLSNHRFAYGTGHTFFQAVFKARGHKGVDAAMRNPPTSTRAIERPEQYLNPTEDTGVDLKAVIASLRPWVGLPPWASQQQRVLEGTLKTQAGRLPEEFRAEYLKGYVDAQMLIGAVPAEDVQIIALALKFENAEDAKRFRDLERVMIDTAQEEPNLTFETPVLVEGFGSEGGGPGFTMHRIVTVAGQTVHVHQQVFQVGSVVCELISIGLEGMTRKIMDGAVDHLAARLRGEESTAPPLLYAYGGRTILTINVRDAAGQPVPRATVFLSRSGKGLAIGSGGGETVQCRDGVATARLRKPINHVRVANATDESGEPLDLAPAEQGDIEADAKTVDIVLPAGVRISGTLLTPDEEPAAGVRISARPLGTGSFPWSADATTTTDADGRFELIGLASIEYALVAGGSDHGFPGEGRQLGSHRGGAADLALRIPKVTDVAITVHDQDGQPVRNARVTLLANEGLRVAPTEQTDAHGIARFESIEEGTTYRVEISPADADSHLAEHRVPDWSPKDTTFVVPRGWTLNLIAVDSAGEPVAAVVYRRQRFGWQSHRTDAAGSLRLRGLPEGPVELAALAEGTERDDDPMRVRGLTWRTVKQTDEPVRLPVASSD